MDRQIDLALGAGASSGTKEARSPNPIPFTVAMPKDRSDFHARPLRGAHDS